MRDPNDKPTGKLTDGFAGQIRAAAWSDAKRMGEDVIRVSDAIDIARRIEAIVQKDTQRSGHPCPVCDEPHTAVQVTDKFVHHFCRKCENEKAREGVREGARKEAYLDCAGAIEATLSKNEQGSKWKRLAANLRGEPDDRDACDRGDP